MHLFKTRVLQGSEQYFRVGVIRRLAINLMPFLAVGFLGLAVGNGSLWIDESYTAYFASQESLSDLISVLTSWKGSEAQMPGYVLFIWLWAKLFGTSEIMLRLPNLLFMLMLIAVVWNSPLSGNQKLTVIICLLISPFVWYNINEARSTTALMAFGGSSIVGVYYLVDSSSVSVRTIGKFILWFSIIAGVFINMLFFFHLPVIAWFLVIHFKEKGLSIRNFLLDSWKVLTSAGILTVLIGFYYLNTLQHGAGGAKESPGVQNVAFVFYEFLGFSGLGPSRNALRATGLGSLSEFILPILALSVVWLLLFFLIWSAQQRALFRNFYLSSLLLGLGLFGIGAFLAEFRFWGRHVAFLFPLVPLFLSKLAYNDASHTWVKKSVIPAYCALIVLWCFSAFHIRFDDYYQKEDYRGVISESMELTNADDAILWAADANTAQYYGLWFESTKHPAQWKKKRLGVLVANLDYTELSKVVSSAGGKLLVASTKVDLYDRKGGIRLFLRDYHENVILKTPDFIVARIDSLDSLPSTTVLKLVLFKKPDLYDMKGRLAEFLTGRHAALQIDERDYQLFIVAKRTLE